MRENLVAKILYVIGIVLMVSGLLFGFIFASFDFHYGGFISPIFIPWALGGFIFGMLFIGFSEVIKLLHEINGKLQMSKEANTKEKSDDQKKTVGKQVSWLLTETDKEKINALYPEAKIVAIIPAFRNGYCLVKMRNETSLFVRVVKVNDVDAVEVEDQQMRREIISWYNSLEG